MSSEGIMATNARVIDFVKQIVLAQTGSADISMAQHKSR